jgi:uncharacterized protein (TIGR03435 family)
MTRLRLIEIVILAIGLTAQLRAQTPSFEVASVKLNKTHEAQSVPQMQRGGRLTLINRTLRYLVQFAYSSIESQLHDLQIVGGPDWCDTERFDVIAKLEGNPPPVAATANLARVMMRTLLTDRFQLKLRTELRELPVYALVMARADDRLGPGLRRRPESDCIGFVPPSPELRGTTPLCGFLQGGQGSLSYRGVSISQLTRSGLLTRDRLVVDQTNLPGIFDIDLTWAVEAGAISPSPNFGANIPSTDRPSIFTAIQEQLGLKLTPTRAPVGVLVIADAQLPTPD